MVCLTEQTTLNTNSVDSLVGMVDKLPRSSARVGKSPAEPEAGLSKEPREQDNEREGEGDDTGEQYSLPPQSYFLIAKMYTTGLKVRPAKRRRTTSSTAAATKQTKAMGTETKQKKPGKKRRDLSLLPTMPLDILFTVGLPTPPSSALTYVNRSVHCCLLETSSVYRVSTKRFVAL